MRSKIDFINQQNSIQTETNKYVQAKSCEQKPAFKQITNTKKYELYSVSIRQ